MTFINSFTQFNTINDFSGFYNTFTPQFTFFTGMWNCFPSFDFSSFNFRNWNLWNNTGSNATWNNNTNRNNNTNWNNNINTNYNFTWNNSIGTWNSSSLGDTFIRSANSKTISLDGYNADTGSRLAKDALSHKVGFTKNCAKYVSNALERTGLSNGQRGDGWQMIEILKNNKNFKEISTSIDYKNLPAGCILVYNKGAQGYDKDHGHVEIATGDGRAVSDGITNNIRKPSAIFMPV